MVLRGLSTIPNLCCISPSWVRNFWWDRLQFILKKFKQVKMVWILVWVPWCFAYPLQLDQCLAGWCHSRRTSLWAALFDKKLFAGPTVLRKHLDQWQVGWIALWHLLIINILEINQLIYYSVCTSNRYIRYQHLGLVIHQIKTLFYRKTELIGYAKLYYIICLAEHAHSKQLITADSQQSLYD